MYYVCTHTVVEFLENISEQISGMDSSGERDNEQVRMCSVVTFDLWHGLTGLGNC